MMRGWRRSFVFGVFGIAALCACDAFVGFSELQKVQAAKTKDSGKGPDEETEAGGKGPKGQAGVDGGGNGAPRCNPEKPFGIPELLVDLDGNAETHSAVMTPDELEVFYMRGADDFRHGRRNAASDDSPWTIDSEPMNPGADQSLAIAAGGLKLYYWRLDNGGDSKPLKATREKLGDPFGVPELIVTPKMNPIFVVASDDEAYYIESVDGGDQVVKVGTINAHSAGGGKQVANIHVPGSRANYPVLNFSQTTIYFTSNRGADQNYDIYVAHRPQRAAEFGPAVHVPELSTGSFDAVTWVSDDDCELLIDRASHIYRARRPLE